MSTIAERLKRARTEAGLTQAELARLADVSNGAIGNIESGIRREPRELLAIAAAVNVRPEWLRDGKGPQRSPGATEKPSILAAAPIGRPEPWPLDPFITRDQWAQLLPEHRHAIAYEASKALANLQAMARSSELPRKPPRSGAT